MMHRCQQCGKQQEEDYGSWDQNMFFCSSICTKKYDEIMKLNYDSLNREGAIKLLRSIGCGQKSALTTPPKTERAWSLREKLTDMGLKWLKFFKFKR